jgi:putative transposase
VVAKLQEEFAVSERRACRVLGQPRTSQRYRTRCREDEPALVKRILELAQAHPRYGYRFITAKLRQEGWQVNAKRVYRLWRREGLKVPQKKRKRRRLGNSGNACHRRRAEHRDHVWCWDFIFDRTTAGSPLKWFSIEDEFTRESLALKVDRSITSEDVIDTLAELFAMRGVPQHIRSDNGPEFIAQAIGRWLERLEIEALYIEPGAPWENGYAESFHSRLRDELLATEEFENLAAARKLTAAWREDYNHYRPHSSLGYLTPTDYAARCAASAPKLLSATPQATSPLQQHSELTQTVLS